MRRASGVLISPNFRKKRGPRWTAVLITIIALAILLVVWWQAGSWYKQELIADRRSEAALEVSLRGNVLTSILNRRFARLQGLFAFAQTNPETGGLAEGFETFASALYLDTSGIINMAIAPGGVMQSVYPVRGNEAVIGYAPLDDPRPQVRADVLQAIETGEIILTGPVDLVQGGTGFILRQAVYTENGEFWGLVNLVLDFQALLSEAGVNDQSGDLVFALRDEEGQIISGSADIFERDPVLNIIELPEGVWELAAVPAEGWEANIQEPFLVFQLSGLVIVILLSSLIYLSISRQSRLAAAVQSRTAELSTVNRQLVQSQKHLEERVEERTRSLSALLEVSYKLAENLELQTLLGVLLDQLEQFIGFDAAVILLLEEGQLFPAAHRETVPSLLEGMSPDEADLWEHWQKSGWIGPIRSNENNPLQSKDREAGPAWMSIPLKIQERYIGMIILAHKDREFYTDRHEQLVMVVANQAAVTIENARLYQQARNLAVLQERQRLARELHDSVSQALFGITLGAKTAHTLLALEPEKAAEPLDYVVSLSNAALTEMRALIFELRPETLETEGLLPALERQAQVLRSRYGVEVETDWDDEEPPLSLSLKEALYRVTQEATNNTAKHAAAKHVTIQLHQNNGVVVLEIKDDGQGFDTEAAFPGHLGLRSMRERIEQLGGSFRLESKIGEGTYIRTAVPVDGSRLDGNSEG